MTVFDIIIKFWQKSGLSEIIGNALSVFGSLPGWVVVLIISIIVAFITDVVSNPATATVLTPIVAVLVRHILCGMFTREILSRDYKKQSRNICLHER